MDALDNLCGATHVEDETDVDELIDDLEENLKGRVDGADSVHVEVEIANVSLPGWMQAAEQAVSGESSGREIDFE